MFYVEVHPGVPHHANLLFEEHVVLGTDTQRLPDLIHVTANILVINNGSSKCGLIQASQQRPARMHK